MRNQKDAGFTLVELMVVIVLVGLLAGTVGVAVWPILFKGEKTAAQTQMKEFMNALSVYKSVHHRYPEDLKSLVTPDPENGFDEGYLDDDEIPLDPWDQEYQYISDGRTYEILSAGPDQILNNDDDIVESKGRGGR